MGIILFGGGRMGAAMLRGWLETGTVAKVVVGRMGAASILICFSRWIVLQYASLKRCMCLVEDKRVREQCISGGVAGRSEERRRDSEQGDGGRGKRFERGGEKPTQRARDWSSQRPLFDPVWPEDTSMPRRADSRPPPIRRSPASRTAADRGTTAVDRRRHCTYRHYHVRDAADTGHRSLDNFCES